jgi:hypothetical protein
MSFPWRRPASASRERRNRRLGQSRALREPTDLLYKGLETGGGGELQAVHRAPGDDEHVRHAVWQEGEVPRARRPALVAALDDHLPLQHVEHLILDVVHVTGRTEPLRRRPLDHGERSDVITAATAHFTVWWGHHSSTCRDAGQGQPTRSVH